VRRPFHSTPGRARPMAPGRHGLRGQGRAATSRRARVGGLLAAPALIAVLGAADPAAPPAGEPAPASAEVPAPLPPRAPLLSEAPLPPRGEVPVLPRPAVGDPEARTARLGAIFPPPAEVAAPDLDRRRATLRRAAALLEAAGDSEGAARAALRALSLDGGGDAKLELWDLVARLRARHADWEGAEAALLAASEAAPGAAWPLQALGELYLSMDRRVEALAALEEAQRLAPQSPRVGRLLATARWQWPPLPEGVTAQEPASEAAASPPAPREPAQPQAPPAWTARLAGWLRASAAPLPAPLPALADGLADALSRPGASRLAWAVLALAGAALLAPLLLRQRGDLAVALRYPEELRGTFRVRLARTRGSLRRRGEASRAEVLKGGVSSRREHHLVSRETHFPRVPAGRWFVRIEGLLDDPDGEEVLSDVTDTRVLRVRPRRTVRAEFDLRPRSCPVDLEVRWSGELPRDVLVWTPALAGPPVDARGRRVRIFLPKGRHVLELGCGDRVIEHEVEVESFQPMRVGVDIAEADRVVFRGCPPAVEPYLRGDLQAVARALEADGQPERAHRVLGRAALAEGHRDRAAEHFEQAAMAADAAALWEDLGELDRAARAWMDAGDPQRAGGVWRRAGEWVRAGDAFEAARDFDAAVACFEAAGETSKQIDALDRRGDTFRAAQIALDNGWRARAIRLLRQIPGEDPHYAEACALLADAFEREGHWDLAAQKLDEHIKTQGGPGSAPPDLQWRLSEMVENAGNLERALALLEELRSVEPTYPNLATRIEMLRKKRSALQTAVDGARTAGSGDLAPPTMFLSDYRYEVLEEIGRGAMGVVFRARDRRLSRIVALKRLPETMRNYPRAVQLFLREAQSTARLNHPNIVTVFDADQEDGTFFITMELLEGRPLHHVLAERGRLDAAEVARLGAQVARGLAYAHGQGVIHRDVKTANLFLSDDGTLKITDFGLAKSLEEVRRAETGIGGTPFYMAPEQIAGEEVDARADLYALGATLCELATGRVPFSDGDVTYHHRHTPPPDPRRRVPGLPDALAELVLELLEKDPGRRCPSADLVVGRLEALAAS